MSEHSLYAPLSIICPLRQVPTVVYTALSSFGDGFIAVGSGCDFYHGSEACTECAAKAARYWKDLHDAHPDLSASQLKDLQP